MLSRVANCIFWLNRYIERAESVARFIDVNLNMTLDLGEDVQGQWEPLVFTTGDQELFAKLYGLASEQNVIDFLTFDERNPNSILSCVKFARENARTVRETISTPMWEEVNKFYLAVREAKATSQTWASSYDFFNHVKLFSQEFAGITDATMTHDEAWHFSRLGRLLERGDKTSRILDVKYYLLLPSAQDVGTPLDIIEWGALLKSASALEMYRQRHGRITPAEVAQFLVLDREFPRAMHFCVIKGQQSLRAILGDQPSAGAASPPMQLIEQLRQELHESRIETIIAQGLHEFIDNFQTRVNDIGEAITQAFFGTEAPVEECGQEQSE
jgi:uncharacterized alpha-E superfamily protein